MSFILDALKKSELDRQEQGHTEFTGVPTATAPSTLPRWLWTVVALLVVTVAVLAGLLLKSDDTQQQAQRVGEPVLIQQPVVTNETSTRFMEQVARARENAPKRQTEEASNAMPGASSSKMPNASTATLRADLISQDPSSVAAESLYPTIHEARISGISNIPQLHLDFHAYSAKRDARFVFINMAKVREGAQLKEGPVVAEITPDGVVLGHQGQFFLLPRD